MILTVLYMSNIHGPGVYFSLLINKNYTFTFIFFKEITKFEEKKRYAKTINWSFTSQSTLDKNQLYDIKKNYENFAIFYNNW